jgi:rubrerythrin
VTSVQRVAGPEAFDLASKEMFYHRTFAHLAHDNPGPEVDALERGHTSNSRFFVREDRALSLAKTMKDPLKAVDIAIAFEKDTQLFFYELLNVTPAMGKEAAKAIVEKEMRRRDYRFGTQKENVQYCSPAICNPISSIW